MIVPMRAHTKINAITAIILVLVIVVSSLSQKPREAMDQGPVYSGSLWRGMIPVEYLSYRALEGKLSYGKISTPREFIVGVDQTETRMVNSTIYTLSTREGSTYYLVTNEHKPITDNRYVDILNASTVYIKGNSFDYLAPNGRVLKMIEPMDVTVQPVRDLVEASREVITAIVGERYFNSYFSNPILWKDEWEPDRMYTVEYKYRCDAMREQPYRTVSLVFNSDRMLVGQRGIPDEGSLQPFSVSEQEAVKIALDNGFPDQGEPSVHVSVYTHPDEWSGLAGNITLQTYYDPRYCAEPINLTHYMWNVGLETSPEDSSHEVHRYAVLDANTGKLYLMREFTIFSIATTGFGDLFNPERALSRGIPGYVKVAYVTDPPTITIVSPGEKVTYSIELSLISFTDNFTETLVVLDTKRGGQSGINYVMLSDHVSYDNVTCFVLSRDNPVKVNMAYSVSDDAEYGFALPSSELLGEGINSVVPVRVGRGGHYSSNALWDFRVDLLLDETEVLEGDPYEERGPGVSFNKYWAVASKLNSMLRTGEMPRLNETFVTHYPDWSNGTAYVALTDVSEEATAQILGLFSEEVAENIRFIHAPAPRSIIKAWIRHIEENTAALSEMGVRWTSIGLYYDGRILVGVEEIKGDTVEVFNGVLRIVPRGAVVLWETGPMMELEQGMGGSNNALGSWIWIRQNGSQLSPTEQARGVLVKAVGEEYVNLHFEHWLTEQNEYEPEEGFTHSGYFYLLQVGNYTARREVSFYFDAMNWLIKAEGNFRILLKSETRLCGSL